MGHGWSIKDSWDDPNANHEYRLYSDPQLFGVVDDVLGFADLLGWDHHDQQVFNALPWDTIANEAVTRFYARIQQIPELDGFIRKRTTYDRMRALLWEHLQRLRDNPQDLKAITYAETVSLGHLSRGIYGPQFQAAYALLMREVLNASRQGRTHTTWSEQDDAIFRRMVIEMFIMSATQVAFTSRHDGLTQLPNRDFTEERIQDWMGEGTPFTVIFADLNGFKPINDQYGHGTGDKVLQIVARRWRQCLHQSDWIGRWGGDEFLIVCRDPHNSVSDLVATLRDALTVPIAVIPNHPLSVSASFGWAHFPQDGKDTDTLLQVADQSLYAAKRARQSWLLDPIHPAQFKAADGIAFVDEALRQDRVRVFYQPIIEAKSHTIWEWEALVRIEGSDGRLYAPKEFLPAIAQHHLLRKLDDRVMRLVFQDISHWHQHGWTGHVAINLSYMDLRDPSLLSLLASYHQQWPSVKPHALTFEILESALLVDMDPVKQTVSELDQRGYHFALDDFGTGFSSLVHLRELPIRQIKIDIQFVADWASIAGSRLLQALLAFAQTLHVPTVAEGVESLEQGRALARWGVTGWQGYAISYPLPAHEVVSWQLHFDDSMPDE
ncbi:diguanylate cyclase (GGDEF) domain-containing protein [Sulfobacillus thermosulfidooxidans DSM 9293]|uniref:Diguanylate cyclase DosC n=1 Tax=Sulfobacillus thermosulfidooxidans (strain DSM 9293 / VKM B-1269 / AT-1) TaxID=929705 RepID=A0A1W1WHE3_SULTA|nr:EAL domain-containing protein [Sulfobacillus thermosulfidooxidans]SMC05675.1 diguanylate cyclase (GGDEF) domain-containing protein [Sulfobacillus thermosulfidooxidans DSM 9293]